MIDLRPRILVAVVAALVAVGCSVGGAVPRELAATEAALGFCQWRATCCRSADGGAPSVDEEDCRATVIDDLEQVLAQGDAMGLVYDATCVGARITAHDDIACDPPPPSHDGCTACPLFFGAEVAGEVCLGTLTLSDCAPGLVCRAGVCQNRCPVGPGQSCRFARCRDGAWCTPEARCERLAPLGEPCGERPCESGARCVDRQCVPLGRDGEPCRGHDECSSGHCPDGSCQPRPELGEPCPAGVCARGLSCRGGACDPADALVCSAPAL